MTVVVADSFQASDLKPYLLDCGYRQFLLRAAFRLGEARQIDLVAFAHPPADARSACIAVIDAESHAAEAAAACRPLAAPVVFTCSDNSLQWWKQAALGPERIGRPIPALEIPRFFNEHGTELGPQSLYRAKTWGRFQPEYQLKFVDLGLMPVVEREAGQALDQLIERQVAAVKSHLGWESIDERRGHWLLQTIFWLVSAKILRDKDVQRFHDLDLSDVDEVFARVAKHYGTTNIRIEGQKQRAALRESAVDIGRFTDLSVVTTESLAFVYENTLVSKETRWELGTHSTPPYLVDYVLGKLAPWIEEIPWADRNVFEPACGHSAFLVSAMRLLTELLPPDQATPANRRNYLRRRVHGCELDDFALEIARLCLTLADIPNPDGWDLQPCDMFEGDLLERQAAHATILLANAPFARFTLDERARYRKRGVHLRFLNKTAEMLGRTLSHLPSGGVFGVVVPQGLLHEVNSTELRRLLLQEFEMSEICCFPDKIFTFSDMESAVIVGRRRGAADSAPVTISFRRVRDTKRDAERFKQDYAVSWKCNVHPSRFESARRLDLRIPELDELWHWCREHHGQLLDIADAGLGFIFHGRDLPKGARTYALEKFPGAVRGFRKFDDDIQLHQLPRLWWLNLADEVLLRQRAGTTTDIAQVLLNYAPVGRGPWRLKALIDDVGRPISSRFIAVRPVQPGLPLVFLWAVLNSPLANSFAYCHLGKRDNIVSTIRQIPVPRCGDQEIARLAQAARAYLDVVSESPGLRRQLTPSVTRDLMLRVDAAVMRLYGLPTALERQLLDLFAGWDRPGVPFAFNRYFPEHFEDCLSLHDLLAVTQGWEQTNRRRGELIQKKAARRISAEERTELDRLQALADHRLRLIAPLPLKELERFERELESRQAELVSREGA